MSKIKKVVLSGGPYSGKSTLVNEFENLGYPVVKEAALFIINKLNDTIGVEEQIKYRDNNIDEFQKLIFEKQTQLEKQAILKAKKLGFDYIICDRGVYDAIPYYQLFNKEINKELLSDIKNVHYDLAFICEVLPNFDPRTTTGRFEDENLSKKLSEYSYDSYLKNVDQTIWLPVMSVDERLGFITDYL